MAFFGDVPVWRPFAGHGWWPSSPWLRSRVFMRSVKRAAVAVPFFQDVAVERVTGAAALTGQHGELVQVWMLRPTGGNGVGNLPDLLGDEPIDSRVQPRPQLLPQLWGTAARRLPRSRQQPTHPQGADLLRAAGRGKIKFAVGVNEMRSGRDHHRSYSGHLNVA
jgi:hypothetical protein